MIAAVIDHLWQSTLFAIVAGLLTLLLRKNSANARFCLWLAASVKFLIPFSLLVALGGHLAWAPAPPAALVQWTAMVEEVARPAVAVAPALTALPAARQGLDASTVLAALWALGFVTLVARWLAQWLRIRAILRASAPLQLGLPIPVVTSPMRQEPGIFGIVRPVLLLPDGIRERLAPRQLEAVLAHELCHVRRRDNLTAALHMFVTAVFWFHPLLWWIGARMIAERERACDEAVIRSGGDPETYAEGILNVCRLYVEPRLACVAGVAGGNLKKRIEDIMTKRIVGRLHPTKKFLLIAAGLLALTGPIAVGIGATPDAAAENAAPTDQAATDAAKATRLERYAEQAKTFKAVPIDPKLLDLYVGNYQQEGAVAAITRDGDRLMIQLTGQMQIEVSPYDDHEFFQPDVHAQLSFVTDGHGPASAFVLHQGGYDRSWKRIDDAEATAFAAKLAERIKNKTPAPGSEAALRHYFDELQQGKSDFDGMSDELTQLAREQLPAFQKLIAPAGALQSITFRAVGPAGADIYDVKYANAAWEWRISMGSDGKVIGLFGRPAP
jgi:beta-lactamase regulating signal transducer with metallopeptidase domain